MVDEVVLKELAGLNDEQLIKWAGDIALTPAPDEPVENFRKRVIDVLDYKLLSPEDMFNQGMGIAVEIVNEIHTREWEFRIAREVDDWLTDNEIGPKPIDELAHKPGAYFKQLVSIAPFWKAEERLTVASMLIGQPLMVQGADDAAFYLPSDLDIGAQFVSEIVVIKIRGLTIADTNRPATEAWRRFINKMDEEQVSIGDAKWFFQVRDSWKEMYMYLHSLARNGVFVNLNDFSSHLSPLMFDSLKKADEKVRQAARGEMEKAEGK